jgi:hypothetical protein
MSLRVLRMAERLLRSPLSLAKNGRPRKVRRPARSPAADNKTPDKMLWVLAALLAPAAALRLSGTDTVTRRTALGKCVAGAVVTALPVRSALAETCFVCGWLSILRPQPSRCLLPSGWPVADIEAGGSRLASAGQVRRPRC